MAGMVAESGQGPAASCCEMGWPSWLGKYDVSIGGAKVGVDELGGAKVVVGAWGGAKVGVHMLLGARLDTEILSDG